MIPTFEDYQLRKQAEPINESASASTAPSNKPTIENIRYYKVSKEDYIKAMNAYDVDLNKFKAGVTEKKPPRPTYVKGSENGVYFKRASKQWCADHRRNKVYDFVDIKITPLLKHGTLYRTLIADDNFKKILYVTTENGDIKLNKEILGILKPFLFKPETSFNRQFTSLVKRSDVDPERIEKIKEKFKDDSELNRVFRNLVESIWDYLSNNQHKVYKKAAIKKEEEIDLADLEEEGYVAVDITVYDELLEDLHIDEYDEETEYEYDMLINESKEEIISYEDYLKDID